MIILSEIAIKLVKFRQESIILIDNSGSYRIDILDNIAKRYRTEDALANIHIIDKCILSDQYGGKLSIIIFDINEHCINALRKLSSRILFATCAKIGNLRKLLRFRVAYLKHAYGKEYILMYSNESVRIRIEPAGIYPALQKPKGILGKALAVLKDGIMEYGPLTTKDALYVLVGNLKIDKKYARRILQELVNRKYVRIEGGYILLNI